jgi:hypothetical protein
VSRVGSDLGTGLGCAGFRLDRIFGPNQRPEVSYATKLHHIISTCVLASEASLFIPGSLLSDTTHSQIFPSHDDSRLAPAGREDLLLEKWCIEIDLM